MTRIRSLRGCQLVAHRVNRGMNDRLETCAQDCSHPRRPLPRSRARDSHPIATAGIAARIAPASRYAAGLASVQHVVVDGADLLDQALGVIARGGAHKRRRRPVGKQDVAV